MRVLYLFLIFLQSCQVYKSDFGSPPDKGISNKSLSEIDSMVIESDGTGPDVLVERDSHLDQLIKRPSCHCEVRSGNQRIWVPPRTAADGSVVGGYFIYFFNDQQEGKRGV